HDQVFNSSIYITPLFFIFFPYTIGKLKINYIMSLKPANKIPAVFYVNAALFDCDGTLVNSTGAISEFWRGFAETRPHVDAEEIIRTSHGCRTFDVIAKWSPDDAVEKQVTEWEASIPDS